MKTKIVISYAALIFGISLFFGVQAYAADITAAAFGDIYNYNAVTSGHAHQGDTVYNAWGANDYFYMAHDDGAGFGSTYYNVQLDKLDGDPNYSTNGVQGSDLDPGSLSNNMPQQYSAGIYEVDGVLYQAKFYSCQSACGYNTLNFYNTSLIKSSDGGANWYNAAGQLNTVTPNNLSQSTFPSNIWGFPTFINYGKGGSTPNVDNANSYVYLVSHDSSGTVTDNPLRGLYGDDVYLARILRSNLANLNPSDFEYYVSGDGSQNAAWTSTIGNELPIFTEPANIHGAMVNYDYGLQRYVMSGLTEFFPSGATTGQKYRLEVYTALHPWGPWTRILSNNEPHILGGYLANNKFTSPDGKKMWWVESGLYNGDFYPYGLVYHSMYLSDGTVDTYQAESATLQGGTSTASTYPSYTGTGYVNNFTNVGDGVRFTVNNVNGAGWHIVKFRYASTNTSGNYVSAYVNGTKVKGIQLDFNDNSYKTSHNWTEDSEIYYLNNGTNTFDIKLDTGDVGTGLLLDNINVSENTTYDEGQNVAMGATASASSSLTGYSPSAVNNGIIEGSGQNLAYYWEANTTSNEWIKLTWSSAATINKIVLYGIPQTSTQVTSGTLTFSDGSSVNVGKLQSGSRQAGTVVTFPAKTVTWATFTITGQTGSCGCEGLAQFEAFTPSNNKVDDSSGNANITYTGGWSSGAQTGFYGSSGHWDNVSGDYVSYNFTGPDITWIGAIASTHGKADVYIDGTLDATVDTYAATTQYQHANYVKTGLANGSHTIKIVLRSDKNTSSTGYYTDVDAFCVGCGTRISNADGGITYSGGGWSSGAQSGFYYGTAHWDNTASNYAQYSFYGTNITWIGALDSTHGKVDVYIDGTFDSTVDTYAASTSYQNALYVKTGLSQAEHTIKLVIRSDKNASSSGYYTDVDSFQFSN